MAPNEFGGTANGQQDEAFLTPVANPFSSEHPHGTGMFPKLAPRKFPDDEDPAPEPVPAMEPLPAPASSLPPPPTYGPPPSFNALAERAVPDSGAPAPHPQAPQYEMPRSAGIAPPLPQAPQAGHNALLGAPVPGMDRMDMPPESPVASETSELLTTDWLLHSRRTPPGPGWRRTIYRASGGLVNVGESAANLRRRDFMNRVRTPVAGGHHRVAVMSLKGGVGKTTSAVCLGATLASLRGDRVIAMDANPDRGTLVDKVRLETAATVRDLLKSSELIRRYADVRQFTSQAPSRLEILASDRDPGVSIAFSADDYREVSRVLEHHYSIAITDCGTGLLHSAMAGILQLADHIVLVSSPSVDGARSASATLDWLEAHEYTDLVRGAVVVLSTIRPRSRSTVDLDRLEAHFASRCRDVVRIPYDAHLEEGAEVELDLLSNATRDAYLTLAATVADGFAVPRRSRSRAAI
jgi:MinD-like ATPase involved in chromosome partitioning or flagellar assembly